MAEKPLLFDTGYVVRTFGALNAMLASHMSEWSLLERHCSGDFGDIGETRLRSNHLAIAGTGRVFSAYHITPNATVWIITSIQPDRQTTTVLMPAEYARRARANGPRPKRVASLQT